MTELESVRAKSPTWWDPAEAQFVKALFAQQRPAVEAWVARMLWRYWQHRQPDEPLFDDDEQNLALLLHARAYGEPVPSETYTDALVGRLQEHHAELYQPLADPSPEWGPIAALATEIRAGLDSPILDAWVFSDGNVRRQILVVGTGIPEIRDEVMREAFLASLRAGAQPMDCMNRGLIRVEAAASDEPLLPLDFFVPTGEGFQGGTQQQAALEQLIEVLRRVERETGLVRVIEAQVSAQTAIAQAVTRHATAAAHEAAGIWRPCGLDEPGNGRAAELVTIVPYRRTDRPGVLTFQLSGDLLRTAAFERLVAQYERQMLASVRIDAELRRDYNQREAERMDAERTEYLAARDKGDVSAYPETVSLNITHDPKTGTDVRSAKPTEMDTEAYYVNYVPGLVRSHEDWALRMAQTVAAIDAATRREDAPVRGLAAARYLDAVLRELVLDDDPATVRAFQGWRKQVAPMLRLEWRAHLRRNRIDPLDVHTPHTVFHARGLRSGNLWAVSPLTVLDRRRSVAVFDRDRRVVVVRDPTDRALAVNEEPTDSAAWDQLEALAKGRPAVEDFAAAFAEALRTDPHRVVARTLGLLGPEAAPPDEQLDVLQRALANAQSKTVTKSALHWALRAAIVGAFQTARSCVARVEDSSPDAVRARLLGALIECLAAGLEWERLAVLDASRPAGAAVASQLERANAIDASFARAWLDGLERLGLAGSLNKLYLGLPADDEVCGAAGSAVLLARRAAESVRLARDIERAAAALDSRGEYLSDVFGKYGRPLDEYVLGEFASGSTSGVSQLIGVLTGREQPQYGGAVR